MIGNTVLHNGILQNIRNHSSGSTCSPERTVDCHVPDHRMLCAACENSPFFFHCDHVSRLYLKIHDLRILHRAEQSTIVPGWLVHTEVGYRLSISIKMSLKRRYFSRPHIRFGAVKSDRDPVHSPEIDIFSKLKPGTLIISWISSLSAPDFHPHGRQCRKSDQMLFCSDLVRFFLCPVPISSA